MGAGHFVSSFLSPIFFYIHLNSLPSTGNQTLTTSIEFTYADFPCHLKVYIYKFAMEVKKKGKSTKILRREKHRITSHYRAELQTAKKTLTA